MSDGYLVVEADDSSVTIEDHTKPLQRNGAYPTVTFMFNNTQAPIAAGDRIEMEIKLVSKKEEE